MSVVVSCRGGQRGSERAALVVIGASTGGTRVLPQLLSRLEVLRAAVLIVQHMPEFITPSFARTLQQHSAMPVRIVEQGDVLAAGRVYLCPGGLHCEVVGNDSLNLSDGPKVNHVRPSVDVTMLSVRRTPVIPGLCAVILTGMGRDGAAGLAHIKDLGGLTLAQDQASCAVFGMPKMAIETGRVDHVLDSDGMARLLARTFGEPGPLTVRGSAHH